MELFGHGQDIADTVGTAREYTDRLEHLVGFTILVRDFGYEAHGLTPPPHEFRFEITAPSGAVWAFGPEDSPDRVRGSAADLCLLASSRSTGPTWTWSRPAPRPHAGWTSPRTTGGRARPPPGQFAARAR